MTLAIFVELAATGDRRHVFVIDSTGELRDWTAHADVVIIGKSFLSTGGQNPSEAILAEKPVIFGPHMENFQPLASRLVSSGGCISASDAAELSQAIRRRARSGKSAGDDPQRVRRPRPLMTVRRGGFSTF